MILSCNNFSKNNIREEVDQSSNMFHYLALGDSYTIGESVDSMERWPVVLSQKLNNEGIIIDDVKIVAQTGWTTKALLDGINEDILQEEYALVTLLIGVNNQFQGRDTLEYKNEFKILLNKSIELTGNQPSRVVVVSIPDYGVTPFGISKGKERIAKEIDLFNAINYEESLKAGVGFVDVTAISREAEIDSSLIAEDGLHPSGEMYKRWVDQILPLAKEILTSKNKK